MPIWWWQLTKVQKVRSMAGSLLVTPMIMLFPISLGPFAEPSLLIEFWDFYLLFFGLPLGAAAALWLYSRRLSRESRLDAEPQSLGGRGTASSAPPTAS